ncbi:hypothetical protein NPIL_596681 [Nephila pilipes]|uniref:Uncharacterized protein n=1 Tax=Nephila pilipes TaxID=299642 RepID=A0A8X6J6D4_NEPPI|nr:hypothetical protein NPIL_596681 [Nephila pilipes]
MDELFCSPGPLSEVYRKNMSGALNNRWSHIQSTGSRATKNMTRRDDQVLGDDEVETLADTPYLCFVSVIATDSLFINILLDFICLFLSDSNLISNGYEHSTLPSRLPDTR